MAENSEKGKVNSSFILYKMDEISKTLEISSIRIIDYATYSEVDDNNRVPWNYINVELFLEKIKRSLKELATISPGIRTKNVFNEAMRKSTYYRTPQSFWGGGYFDKEILKSLYVDLGEIMIYSGLLKEKAIEYENAKTTFYKLNIGEILEPLIGNKKPMDNIKNYLANVNETIRRDGQLQFLRDDWNKLTSALELASMYKISNTLRKYMDLFDSKYGDKTTFGEMEKSNREEINSILNKLKMALDDCSIEC